MAVDHFDEAGTARIAGNFGAHLEQYCGTDEPQRLIEVFLHGDNRLLGPLVRVLPVVSLRPIILPTVVHARRLPFAILEASPAPGARASAAERWRGYGKITAEPLSEYLLPTKITGA